MNRWSRIVLGIALLASAAWVAVGAAGGAADRDPEAMVRHTLLAYAATLVWLLADTWIVVFLIGCERAARRLAPGPAPALAGLARARRRVASLGAASAALALGQFAFSGLLYPDRFPAAAHVTLALLALLAQLVFVASAARALTGLEARLEECANPPAGRS
jgi:hypothetical protein